jgi:hypothetical protein
MKLVLCKLFITFIKFLPFLSFCIIKSYIKLTPGFFVGCNASSNTASSHYFLYICFFFFFFPRTIRDSWLLVRNVKFIREKAVRLNKFLQGNDSLMISLLKWKIIGHIMFLEVTLKSGVARNSLLIHRIKKKKKGKM